MLLTEYDEKKWRQLDRKEGYEDGFEEGEAYGIELGIQQSIIIILEELGEIPDDIREKKLKPIVNVLGYGYGLPQKQRI